MTMHWGKGISPTLGAPWVPPDPAGFSLCPLRRWSLRFCSLESVPKAPPPFLLPEAGILRRLRSLPRLLVAVGLASEAERLTSCPELDSAGPGTLLTACPVAMGWELGSPEYPVPRPLHEDTVCTPGGGFSPSSSLAAALSQPRCSAL